MAEENSLEHRQVMARRLVATLNVIERRILVCLVHGMSSRDIAAVLGFRRDDFERSKASMMSKLNALTAADAVRIGLYAEVDPPRLNVSIE